MASGKSAGVGATVETGEIATGAVTTAKVADNAIDKDKLGILTTKGDTLVYSTEPARVAVGTNDQVLTADSAQASGLKWAAAGSGAISLVGTGSVASGVDATVTVNTSGSDNTLLMVKFHVITDSSSSVNYTPSLRINGKTASTDYRFQRMSLLNGSWQSSDYGDAAEAEIGFVNSGTSTTQDMGGTVNLVVAGTNKISFHSESGAERSDVASGWFNVGGGTTTFTASNITSVTIFVTDGAGTVRTDCGLAVYLYKITNA